MTHVLGTEWAAALERADTFHNGLRAQLIGSGQTQVPVSARTNAGFAYCTIALEHGSAFQFLLRIDNPTTALSVVRLQYEAVIRCAWLQFAATQEWVDRFSGPAPPETQREPEKFPLVPVMLQQLQDSSPDPLLYQSLATLKDKAWDSLNSYTHGGLRLMARVLEGFEEELLHWMLRTTNSLSYVAAQLLAYIVDDPARSHRLSELRKAMPDCMHQ